MTVLLTKDTDPWQDTTAIMVSNVVIPKTSGYGIRVDTASPSFGWKDLTGQVHIKATGASDPGFNVYRTNIRQYQFAVGREVWLEYHMPHDYLPGSEMFIHAHWSLITTEVENVTWGFDLTYAKGYARGLFNATVNCTKLLASTGVAYTHMISEVQCTGGALLTTANLEVDGLLLVRCYLSANSGAADPFLHFVDLHYQSNGVMGTKDKNYPFYS